MSSVFFKKQIRYLSLFAIFYFSNAAWWTREITFLLFVLMNFDRIPWVILNNYFIIISRCFV